MVVLGLVAVFGLIDLAIVSFGVYRLFTKDLDPVVVHQGDRSSPLLKNSSIWLLTTAVIIGYPTSAFIYYSLLLKSGALPTYADSIAIPIGYSVMIAIALTPLIVGVTYACTWKRTVRSSLTAWRSDRPLYSLAITLLFAVPAAFYAAILFQTLFDPKADKIERAWDLHALVCVAWSLTLRSVALRGGRNS